MPEMVKLTAACSYVSEAILLELCRCSNELVSCALQAPQALTEDQELAMALAMSAEAAHPSSEAAEDAPTSSASLPSPAEAAAAAKQPAQAAPEETTPQFKVGLTSPDTKDLISLKSAAAHHAFSNEIELHSVITYDHAVFCDTHITAASEM